MIRRVLCVLVGLVLVGCTSSGAGDQPQKKLQGFGLTPPLPRPSFLLMDTAGRPFSFAKATSGRPTLLFFGYTKCPDICPTTMVDISAALGKVPRPIAKRTMVVFVSTDVGYDTGPVIARWLAKFSPGLASRFVGLRGTQAQIDGAQAASHIPLAEDNGQTHSALVQLYGPDDYARVGYGGSNTEAQQIAHDLPIIAR